ncbi:hypothetical protein [Streptomyces sp. NPDC050856]|uniref:hypothetical protein n=1 Tax=Streptomyces sp. NPDC050856 TaxID=3154939 RepID=UPI003407EC2B
MPPEGQEECGWCWIALAGFAALQNIADGGPLTAYAHLARSTTDPTVHLVSHGCEREITSTAMDKFGFDRQKVRTTYPEVLAGLPSAAPLT